MPSARAFGSAWRPAHRGAGSRIALRAQSVRSVAASSHCDPVSVYAPPMVCVVNIASVAVRRFGLRTVGVVSNYVVKRTCGEKFFVNRTLSAAGRLPRR